MKGRLPREARRKQIKVCVVIMIIFSLLLLTSYAILQVIFRDKVRAQQKIDKGYGIFRAFGMSINAYMLALTIYKLKKAKVQRTDSGHLKILDASVLLILMILMIISGLVSSLVFEEKQTLQIYVDCIRDSVDYLIGVMYFKMIIHFITNFTLQTKVDRDGDIQIVGIDKNGHEVFVFNINEEQHQKLLGFANEQIQKYQKNRRKSKYEKKQKKGQYYEISENGSTDDFSDATRSALQTPSNADAQSNFVSAFGGSKRSKMKRNKVPSSPMFGKTKQIEQINKEIDA